MRKSADLYDKLDDLEVKCRLCSHECTVAPSGFGICGMRRNIEGELFTYAYGDVVAANVDPIEKKPLYHFLPGTASFSIATPGCNFRCGFCQNWQISQMSKKKREDLPGRPLSPEEAVEKAKAGGCASVAYTYTEPTVFFEYARDVGLLARENGLSNVFVTNGFMTAKALEAARPFLDACNVDLKSFSDDFYLKTCKGRLQPVLDSIALMNELGIWVEVTTLVVPGSNDSEKELASIAEFVASVDPDIPWHISRFHPDYEFSSQGPTPLETMHAAARLGKEAGLRYVYLGNVPEDANTLCPECGKTVLSRRGYFAGQPELENGACGHCGAEIAGVF